MKNLILLSVSLVLLSCNNQNSTQQNDESVPDFEPHELPENLSELTGEDFEGILPMLGDARIIGLSEGTHEMIEPIQFRNELLKYLIINERIDIVAIESGLIESKLANDYVNGKDIEIDSVLNYGLVCNFGEIDLNKELLTWLRDYNEPLEKEKRIQFFGYDIPGCAPNPVTENARFSLNYVLDFLEENDPELYGSYSPKFEAILPLLHIKDQHDSDELHFWDIDSVQWNCLFTDLDDLESELNLRKEQYNKEVGVDEFVWVQLAMKGARQNVEFLHSIGNSDYDYSPREKGQLDNIKWLLDNKPGSRIAIFAHLAHIAKELHMKTENGMVVPMAGEHIKEEFGDDYIVIGNFYRKLDWFDNDPIVLEDSLVANELQKYKMKNFFMQLDKSDTIWQKEWPFGKSSSGGQVYMIPSEAVDIVLYNDVQTWLYHYQED